jgi:hypothetical protein
LTGVVAVQAGAALGVQLQHLQEPGLVAGRRHHLQRPARIGQHQTCSVDREQVHTMLDETVQQLDHVIPVGQAPASSTKVRANSAARSSPLSTSRAHGYHSMWPNTC